MKVSCQNPALQHWSFQLLFCLFCFAGTNIFFCFLAPRLLVTLAQIIARGHGKTQDGNLSRTNAIWKIIQDLLYVLPFTPIEHVVQTYETEVLAKVDEMKEQEETPFGIVATEQKIVQLLGHVERVWVGPQVVLKDRGKGMYPLIHSLEPLF